MNEGVVEWETRKKVMRGGWGGVIPGGLLRYDIKQVKEEQQDNSN